MKLGKTETSGTNDSRKKNLRSPDENGASSQICKVATRFQSVRHIWYLSIFDIKNKLALN